MRCIEFKWNYSGTGLILCTRLWKYKDHIKILSQISFTVIQNISRRADQWPAGAQTSVYSCFCRTQSEKNSFLLSDRNSGGNRLKEVPLTSYLLFQAWAKGSLTREELCPWRVTIVGRFAEPLISSKGAKQVQRGLQTIYTHLFTILWADISVVGSIAQVTEAPQKTKSGGKGI